MTGAYNLIFIIACYFVVNGIYVPAMPSMAEYFHAEGDVVRITITVFQLGALISCIVAGLFADNIGKRRFLLIGLSTALLGSILCVVSPNLTTTIIGRFMQGFGAATGFMMGFALAVDLYEPKITLKIIALNGIIVACVSTFIPYLGGILTNLWNWRATFLVMSILFVIVLFNSARKIPQSDDLASHPLNLKKSFADYIKVATNRPYLCYAVLNAIYIGGLTFSISFLPFFYKNTLDLQPNYIGFMIGAVIWLPFGISSILSTRLYDKISIDKSIYLALAFSLLGALMVTITAFVSQRALWSDILGTVLYFWGFGMLYSGSISKSLSIFMTLTTKASSLRTIMISFFSLFGGIAAQYASDKELMDFALMLVVTTLLAAIIFYLRGNDTSK